MTETTELDRLSKTPSDKPVQTWPDFANNFLFRFFEGQSFAIWLFVSGVLIVLYAKYSSFTPDLPFRSYLQNGSLVFLAGLIIATLYKNFIFHNPLSLADRFRNFTKRGATYRLNTWLAEVLGASPKKLNLPVRIVNFKKISSRVEITNPGKGRWRAGFIFENTDGTEEYIFHTYQDEGSSSFHIRIVGRKPGIEEMHDVKKTLGIEHPHNFNFWVENEGNQLVFYVDGIFAGNYSVPMNSITNINLAAWSDRDPITVLFKDIEVLA